MSRKTKVQQVKWGRLPAKFARLAPLHSIQDEAYHYRLGNDLVEKGKLDDAAASYLRALAINPNSPETINSLGVLLYKAGRLEQSFVCYRKSISLKPKFAEAHNNYGLALRAMGHTDEAIASFERSIHFNPCLAAGHSNLGGSLLSRGDIQGAVSSLRRAIELQSDLAGAHHNFGNALKMQGLLREAVLSYERAISLAPEAGDVYNNLAETYKDQGRIELAVETFELVLARGRSPVVFSNLLCLYGMTRHISPEAEKAVAEQWEKGALTETERVFARQRAPRGSGTFPAAARGGRPLRLGIVSADLGSHAVAYFLEPILETLDRSRFHLTLFSTLKREGSRATHLRSLADKYVSVGCLADNAAADQIRAEQIDVLVDATGHTAGGRPGIFAHRAAPVQCAYLGYTGTTGLTEMDWVFGERSLAAHFTERVWELPSPGTCYRGDTSLPESTWRPDPTGTIWLGCLCRYIKIREETLDLWSKVLHALPEAKLLLEDGAVCEEQTHQRIVGLLTDRGIAEERVTFIPYIQGHERHMGHHNRVDIGLDTLPYNGGTTTFDALWMGVPCVALEGDSAAARMGSVLLKAFDRPQWVAGNEEEYVAIVCALARDVEYRQTERKSQRARMEVSPLCDAIGATRALEVAFERMHDMWLAGA